MKDISDTRFILFIDFLGTTNRYSTPPLVLRSRELLELACDLFIIRNLEKLNMYLYIFSDTLIVTCPNFDDLLPIISNLYSYFLENQKTEENHLNLWLRGAVSYGQKIESSHLPNNSRIRSIPLLDTSLPIAYNLESIRPGSRLFIDPKIDLISNTKFYNYFITWEQMTGRGNLAVNVSELLWPAIGEENNEKLIDNTNNLYTKWKDLLDDKKYSKDEYYESMIHLDETLKLFIRTCAIFCNPDEKFELFINFLPESNDYIIDINYEWGLWFQILKGIIEDDYLFEKQRLNVSNKLILIKEILSKRDKYQHFIGEMRFPNYKLFKERYNLLVNTL